MSENNGMTWNSDLGLGHCPILPASDFYGRGYWDEYVRRSETPLGEKITALRCGLVDDYVGRGAGVLDVGIGCGQFINTRGENTYGFDVNPIGVEWLKSRGIFKDPRDGFQNMTFWDAIEHVDDASRVLSACTGYVFITIPIFRDEAHVRASKHFKPGEHIWYFTHEGLIRFVRGLGFKLVEDNRKESLLMGREDIETFVFRRVTS